MNDLNAIRLNLNFDAAALQEDLARVAPEEWIAHYNPNDFEGDWGGVALHAIGGRTENLRAAPGMQMLYMPTPLLARCPAFQQVLSQFACPLGAVRLLRLAPGAIIREHCDDRMSPNEGEARLHIPVQTDPAVEFYLCGERVVMQSGECWFLNLSLPHRVENRSAVDRVHLVIDCGVNQWLLNMLNHMH